MFIYAPSMFSMRLMLRVVVIVPRYSLICTRGSVNDISVFVNGKKTERRRENMRVSPSPFFMNDRCSRHKMHASLVFLEPPVRADNRDRPALLAASTEVRAGSCCTTSPWRITTFPIIFIYGTVPPFMIRRSRHPPLHSHVPSITAAAPPAAVLKTFRASCLNA